MSYSMQQASSLSRCAIDAAARTCVVVIVWASDVVATTVAGQGRAERRARGIIATKYAFEASKPQPRTHSTTNYRNELRTRRSSWAG